LSDRKAESKEGCRDVCRTLRGAVRLVYIEKEEKCKATLDLYGVRSWVLLNTLAWTLREVEANRKFWVER
jgi:hypothetical protein